MASLPLSALVRRAVDASYTGLLPLPASAPPGQVQDPSPAPGSTGDRDRGAQRALALHLLAARQRLLRLYAAAQWALQQGRGVQAVAGSVLGPLDAQDVACREAHGRLHVLQARRGPGQGPGPGQGQGPAPLGHARAVGPGLAGPALCPLT